MQQQGFSGGLFSYGGQQRGREPMCCICGWSAPQNPQNLWTKEEIESVYQHQQSHIRMQEIAVRGILGVER